MLKKILLISTLLLVGSYLLADAVHSGYGLAAEASIATNKADPKIEKLREVSEIFAATGVLHGGSQSVSWIEANTDHIDANNLYFTLHYSKAVQPNLLGVRADTINAVKGIIRELKIHGISPVESKINILVMGRPYEKNTKDLYGCSFYNGEVDMVDYAWGQNNCGPADVFNQH